MLYWSECGPNGKIRGATLSGENFVTIFEGGLKWPNSIVLHPETDQMYIADGADGRIYKCDGNESGTSVYFIVEFLLKMCFNKLL